MKNFKMKGVAFFIALCLGAQFMWAQGTQNLPEIEVFINQPGKHMMNEYADAGKVKNIKLEIIKSTNYTDNKKMSGLVVSPDGTEVVKPKKYIDGNEIDGLIKAIEDFKPVFGKVPVKAGEHYYVCRSGFKIGGVVLAISGTMVWMPYVMFGETKTPFSVVDYDQLIKLLKEAKGQL